MPTLVLSTWSLPSSRALADAARTVGWATVAVDDNPKLDAQDKIVYYGGTDLALAVAARFHLALLEPPFDLLARLPKEFRLRAVEYACFEDLGRLSSPTFVKPADALNKAFDAGIYASGAAIRLPKSVAPKTPVLLAEPVEWSAEFRCFIEDGQIAAWSPYISFARPNWKPFAQGTLATGTPANLTGFCKRLFASAGSLMPPAFVLDIGLIEERGWAVVEFNPVWCSGLLGAEPRKVLSVLERACQPEASVSVSDRRWLPDRRAPAVQSRKPG